MAIVNLGILAHVDTGKTRLTERILVETGGIPGVVAFHLNPLNVNLIDTRGHAGYGAEGERSLRVLDGVVLMVSAGARAEPRSVPCTHGGR